MSFNKFNLTKLDIATINNVLNKSEHFVKITDETSELDISYLEKKDIERIQNSLRKKTYTEAFNEFPKNLIVPVFSQRAIIRTTHDKITFEREILEKITV